jgi:signal transduction histidine kinase
LRYLKRKSRELQVGGPSRPQIRSAGGISQLEQDLDWAIELQGRQLDLLHQMMEHLPEAMAVIDPASMVVQLNGRMQALGRGGLRSGLGLRDLAQELGLPADSWDALVTLSAQPDASLQVRCPVGERSVYLKTTTFNAQGTQGLRLLMLLDVTELKQSQAQRDQALSFLSHDMRTPVASILALSRQLQSLEGAPAQCAADAVRVMGHAHQLMRLMDGFLFESMAHGQDLNLAQRMIDDLLDDAMAQVRDLASARGMQIVFDSGERYFFVQVSTSLMVRVFMNLLLNAIKYGQRGTQISVLAEPVEPSAVRITVSNRIAELGTDVDETIMTQGFGLGLDFVRTVLQRHQGQLHTDIDKALGLARVSISLPGLMDKA